MILSTEDEDMFLGIHPVSNYDQKDFKDIIQILKSLPMKRISGKPYEF